VWLVLDLGLRQRGAAVDAPVNGFLAFVDQSLLDEPAERAGNGRLIPEVHREIRGVPGAEDAEPLELLSHVANEPLRVLTACAAEVRDGHLTFLRAKFFIDFQLDRKPMAVVTHDVRRVEARH
jgi:hypothetical protein